MRSLRAFVHNRLSLPEGPPVAQTYKGVRLQRSMSSARSDSSQGSTARMLPVRTPREEGGLVSPPRAAQAYAASPHARQGSQSQSHAVTAAGRVIPSRRPSAPAPRPAPRPTPTTHLAPPLPQPTTTTPTPHRLFPAFSSHARSASSPSRYPSDASSRNSPSPTPSTSTSSTSSSSSSSASPRADRADADSILLPPPLAWARHHPRPATASGGLSRGGSADASTLLGAPSDGGAVGVGGVGAWRDSMWSVGATPVLGSHPPSRALSGAGLLQLHASAGRLSPGPARALAFGPPPAAAPAAATPARYSPPAPPPPPTASGSTPSPPPAGSTVDSPSAASFHAPPLPVHIGFAHAPAPPVPRGFRLEDEEEPPAVPVRSPRRVSSRWGSGRWGEGDLIDLR